MDAPRLRIVVGATVAAWLLAGSLVAPVGAAECALSAPSTANVGSQLTIEGTGFPASSSVDIAITIEGGAADEFTVQSNASGALQINLTPEEADAGSTTVVATAGSACTAQVTYLVLGAGQTAPPTNEPAGSPGTTDADPNAPRTDASMSIGGGHSSTATPWALVVTLIALGSAGLFLTRSTQRR